MLRFLAVFRRILLAGVASLIILAILYCVGYEGISFPYSETIGTLYILFSLSAPILGLLMWVISSIYIRKKGQSAAFQQQRAFRKTMADIFIGDITSPFRLIKEQFATKKKLTGYYSQVVQSELATALASGSKAINRLRFFYLVFRLSIYVVGIMSAANVLRSF